MQKLSTSNVINYLARVVPEPGQINELELEEKLIQTGFGPADLRVIARNLATDKKENTNGTRILDIYAKSPDNSHSAHMSIGNEGRNKGVRFEYRHHNAFVRGTYNEGYHQFQDGIWRPLTFEHHNLLEGGVPEIFEEITPRNDDQTDSRPNTLHGPTNNAPDTALTIQEKYRACATYKQLVSFLQKLIALPPADK